MRIADARDVPALVRLINAAYRVEDHLVNADRTHDADVAQLMSEGTFLVEGDFEAAVYVKAEGERGYFGMLAVDPARQKGGLGRLMIEAAEARCRDAGCVHMDLTILDARTELEGYYGRFGYAPNGKIAYPAPKKMRRPFEMLRMTKAL